MNKPQTHQIGDAKITRVSELLLHDFKTTELVPEWKPELTDRFEEWMVPTCLDEAHTHVVISTHAWLVQSPKHTVLVDTAVGNDKNRSLHPFGSLREPFLERLAEFGVQPEAVDYVLHTHLHSDHIGWNTRLEGGRWVPTFPNARTILPQQELDRWDELVKTEGSDSPKAAPYFDSVIPVLEAGRVTPVGSEGGPVLDGFVFHPTPGHCSGHMSIGLSSGADYGFFSGDVMHHPIQVPRPEWSSVFSEDHEKGRASRHWALNHAVETGALVFTPHFPGSSAGRVSRTSEGFAWRFV